MLPLSRVYKCTEDKPSLCVSLSKKAIEWNGIEEANVYVVEVSSNPDFENSAMAETRDISIQLPGLDQARIYYIRVIAKRAEREDIVSNLVVSRPITETDADCRLMFGYLPQD